MLKLSCCDHSYLGIKLDLFKQAIAERVLENGQRLPCLSCRTIYEIECHKLKEIGKISVEEANFLLKEMSELFLEKVMPKPKPKTQEEELEEIYSEFKNLPLD